MAKGTCPVCGNEINLPQKEELLYTRVVCPTCLAELEVVEIDLVRFRRVSPQEEQTKESDAQ